MKRAIWSKVLSVVLIFAMVIAFVPVGLFSASATGSSDDFNLQKFIADLWAYSSDMATDYGGGTAGDEIWKYETDFVDPAQFCVDYLNSNIPFQLSYGLWKTASYIKNPSDFVGDKLDERSYDMAILVAVLKATTDSDQFLNMITNNKVKDGASLTSSLFVSANISADAFDELKVQNLSSSTDTLEELNSWAQTWLNNTWMKNAGDIADNLSIFLDEASTLNDFIDRVSAYKQLLDVSSDVINVLNQLYNSCPDSNGILKQAIEDVINLCTDGFQETLIKDAALTLGDINLEFLGQYVWDNLSEWAASAVGIAPVWVAAVKLGISIGQGVSDLLFSTDATLEWYARLEDLVNVKGVLIDTINALRMNYAYDDSPQNAAAYNQSVQMLFSLHELSADWALEFGNVASSSILGIFFKNNKQGFDDYVTAEKSLTQMSYKYINLYWQEKLAENYTDIYHELFGAAATNNGSTNYNFVVPVTHQTSIPSGYIGIYSAQDLNNIRNNLSGKYILMNDIDLSSWGNWVSINGTQSATLEGNGYSIKNLTGGGLFASATLLTVNNLAMTNVNVAGTTQVGAILGCNSSGLTTINNCYVSGTINGKNNVGGIIGTTTGTLVVKSCYNLCSITASDSSSYVGGILGQTDMGPGAPGSSATITKCYNAGTISGNYYVGGIVGYQHIYGDWGLGEISYCYNSGKITGTTDVGGIAGARSAYYASMPLTNCYNVGMVVGTSTVGGLVGTTGTSGILSTSTGNGQYNYNAGIVQGGSNTNSLFGYTEAGAVSSLFYLTPSIGDSKGTPLTDEQMKSQASFRGYDFNTVWAIDPSINNGYPYLLTNVVSLNAINFDKSSMQLTRGQTGNLSISYDPVNANFDKTVVWSTSNADVVSISNGIVIANNPGIAVITANVGGMQTLCIVTVTEPLVSISLDQSELTLLSGQAATLTVTYDPSDTTDDTTVTWTSSDTDVATVDDGTITACGAGSATITADVGGKTAICEVTVQEDPDEAAVTADKADLTWDSIRNANLAQDGVTTDLALPTSGDAGSTISWASTEDTIVSSDGTVIRPDFSAGDADITLTATITKGDASDTVTFELIVLALPQSDAQAVAQDKAALTWDAIKNTNTSTDDVTTDLTLPVTGSAGSTVSWVSSNEDVVSPDGTVTRPDYSTGDADVTLTATITKGDVSDTVTFELIVPALPQSNVQAVAQDKSALTWDIIRNTNTSQDDVTADLALPVAGSAGSTISWASSNEEVVSTDGTVTRPDYTAGSADVTLIATITKGDTSDTVTFELTVPALPQSDAQSVAQDKAALTWDIIKNINTSTDDVTTDLSLPVAGSAGSTISWASNNKAIISPDGTITRPDYSTGDADVTLTATITKGDTSETVTFNLTVLASPQSDSQAVAADKAVLTWDNIRNANITQDNVTTDLILPISGAAGSTIHWASSNDAIISSNGTVTRPDYSAGDADVTLTATITKGTASDTVTFDLVVTKTTMLLISITQPNNVTGLANGTSKTAAALGLPSTVMEVTDSGNVSANVTWDVDSCPYDPNVTTAQTFAVSGTVALPDGVVNNNDVSLLINVSVTVDAAVPTDKVLQSITPPSGISGLTNDTAKTAAALGLPSTVTMTTDNGDIQADVTWDVDNCSYDPSMTTAQTFTVSGIVAMPDGVVNSGNVSLVVSVNITVDAAIPTDKILQGITQPSDITGLINGTAKSDTALGLPSTVTMVTDGGDVSTTITWDTASCSYDPSATTVQTFTVNGIAVLPDGVVNPNDVSLAVSISVTVDAAIPTDKQLISVTQPDNITGLANGTAKTEAALGLPSTVMMITDSGDVSTKVTWDLASCSYNPSSTTSQTFTFNGTVSLPDGVVNPDGVSLAVSVSVTVDAAASTDKLLISITQSNSIAGLVNGAAKTVAALGLPSTVVMVTDGGDISADVTWDVSSCSYDPAMTTVQTFTVSGTAILPDGVVNTNDISLLVSINVTVDMATATTQPTGQIQIGTNVWNSFLNTITFGLFCKDTQTVNISAGDDNNGPVTIQYYLSAAAMTSAELTALTKEWQTYSSTFNIDPNNKYIIYAKLTDGSNNVAYINSAGIMLYTDSAAVTANISYTKGTNNDQTANVTLNGNTIQQIMNGTATLTPGMDYTVSGETITFKVAYLDSLATGDYTLILSYNPLGIEYPSNALDGSTAPATTSIALTVVNPNSTTVIYAVTVNGSYAASNGSANYRPGTIVTINAGSLSNYSFIGWTTSDNISFTNSDNATTTFTMPATDVTVTANWHYIGNNSGSYYPPATSNPAPETTSPEILSESSPSDTVTIGDNKVTTPTDQPPVNNSDGSVTLPGGGTITTPGGTIITVPAGTIIDQSGNIIVLPNGNATADISQNSTDTIVEPGLTITITDGSTTTGGFEVEWQNPFSDVNTGDWFYGDVEYIYTHGLMVGTSTDPMLFSPQMSLTRGMIVSILYSAAGSPDVSALTNQFSDVSSNQYYTDAVKWAAANGIIFGYGDGNFGPNDNITREQMAAILLRYEQFSNQTPSSFASGKQFSDAGQISDYALSAINQLTAQGIINGETSNTFVPQGQATRAEFAAILHRFLTAIE